MLTVGPSRGAALALGLLAALGATAPAAAQELASHLAVYEVTTGRAPTGVTPPEIRGTYVFRLHAECDGGLAFEQRLRFEARAPGSETVVDQTSTGWESADGKRYRFAHRTSVDGKELPEVRGDAELGAKPQAHFTQPAERIVELTPDTVFPVSLLRRTVKAAAADEAGFEGRFFLGDKPEPPQVISVLLGKPPRRVSDLPPPQGDRALVASQGRFYFRAAFYEDQARSTGEPRHEMSSVTLANGVEIWGTHEQGDLRLEYRLTRIEALPKPKC